METLSVPSPSQVQQNQGRDRLRSAESDILTAATAAAAAAAAAAVAAAAAIAGDSTTTGSLMNAQEVSNSQSDTESLGRATYGGQSITSLESVNNGSSEKGSSLSATTSSAAGGTVVNLPQHQQHQQQHKPPRPSSSHAQSSHPVGESVSRQSFRENNNNMGTAVHSSDVSNVLQANGRIDHGDDDGEINGGAMDNRSEMSNDSMRELEDLLTKLNPLAKEFVPPSLRAVGVGPHSVQQHAEGGSSSSSSSSMNARGNTATAPSGQVQRKKKNGYSSGGRRRSSRTSRAQQEDSVRRTVYVSDIDQQVTEEQLASLFISCGQVVDCRMCGDPNSVLRFAFVEFTDEAGARNALQLAGTVLGFYPVRVLPSKTAIVPVNPTFLPKSEVEREMCARTIYCANIDKKVGQVLLPAWVSGSATWQPFTTSRSISWEELTRLWKKRFIVDDAPTLAINRLFAMTQGNTSTRNWLTEWQKIAATPDLELPFLHLRREFYSRLCAALSLALGDREQYTTFAEIIDKAREIIKTNRAVAHEKSAWQPTYVEKGKLGLRPRHVTAVQPDNIVEEPAATQASREGDQVAVVQPRSNNSRGKGKAKTASPAENGQPAPWVTSPPSIVGDSTTWSGLEELDPLTFADFQWTPLPPSGRLPKPHCNVLMARLRDYLHTAVPTPLMDAGVEVVDLHDYVAKIDREFKTQRCHVVSAASIRASIIRDDIEEMGVCFLHALPPQDIPSTDSPPDPRIIELLDAYGDVFEAPHGVVPDRPIRHEIILEAGAVPPRGSIYRMSEEELSVLRAQVDDLLEKAWIRPSSSPFGAPVLFVQKKNKDLRLCIDYCKLNAQTVKNADPLQRIDDLERNMGGAKLFSKLDLKSGYHQLEIRLEDRYKTAFKTRYEHFEWLVMPFGLTNAPTTFQAAMTMEFRHMLDRFVLVYLDDILVYSRSLDEHVEHLRTVLERLRQAKYKANHDKWEFARQELEYLRHYVTLQGIRPLADKIEAIRVWPKLTNTTDVRSFMGLAGYCQRFIIGYSRIVAPMTRLQSPKVPFVFDDDARRSFQALKTAMLMAPVLSMYYPTPPTRLTTDSSGYGIGAVLEQQDGDEWHPVEYFRHKVPPINSLDDARKELLAFVMALKRQWQFLLGRRRFTWVTDNNPLTYYKTQDTVSNTIGRWMYFIDQFDFTPKHLAGLSNRAADALSRRPDLCAMTHHAFTFDEELQQHFIRGYEFDPDFSTLYAQLSLDHPPASHYRIADGYLLLHSRGKDLSCPMGPSSSDSPSRWARPYSSCAGGVRGESQLWRQNLRNRFEMVFNSFGEHRNVVRIRHNKLIQVCRDALVDDIVKYNIRVDPHLKEESDDAEISTLHAANSQQQTLNDQLQTDVSIGLAQLLTAASTGSAMADCSLALAVQAKQLEERINHVVASLGNISKFVGASTLSNHLQTLSDHVQQRPAAVAKEWKMPNFKIEKFDDYHKTDPLQWWMAFNAEAGVHHTPALRRLDALYLQLIGGAQAFMTHMAVTLECTIATITPRPEEMEDPVHVPPPSTDGGVAVVDLHSYLAKIDREYAMQRYVDIDVPLLYIRIQIRKATSSALIDCGATHNYISQDFMARAGLGPRIRRKSQPTHVTLADGHAQKSIDRCVDSVPVYFAPLACEAVSFDILDTKFDMILGMSWLQSEDHPVNFYRRTVHVRDWRGELVPCTVPPPHPSIGCHVVSAASICQSIRRNDMEERGICFLHALPPGDQPKTVTLDPRIIELLDSYEDVFQAPAGVVPDRPIRHGITLEDGVVPPRGCIYRMSEEELQVLRAQLDDLLAKGWIRPSCSPYGGPVLFIRKKNKDLRLCIDYRKLNAQTIKNVGPLPRIDDLLERLGGAKYFSKLDLKSGYHQIEIQPRDRYKTASKTRYWHFEWIAMCFGLTNAPTTFQAAMTKEFCDLLDRTVLVYLDDILVYNRTLDQHLEHLRAVLDRLRIAKYKANREKCEFAQQEKYLGHYVTPQGIHLLADKVYYRRPLLSWLSILLHALRQRVSANRCTIVATSVPLVPFEFNDEARHAFHTLKTACSKLPS
ncbi:hypothetical protein CBR_g46251 [Chara braunii]|uniref:Reverse transcriptase n=1 Tax=Chara braunii TaxID=69332 RepID=A0A388K3R8_CHABU|nr:hypothetical protein CBR_g46251 [Chara braunii]|eukprot:GBG64708.1 hypothetical protein CBR_g46251 [Chara braunii]